MLKSIKGPDPYGSPQLHNENGEALLQLLSRAEPRTGRSHSGLHLQRPTGWISANRKLVGI